MVLTLFSSSSVDILPMTKLKVSFICVTVLKKKWIVEVFILKKIYNMRRFLLIFYYDFDIGVKKAQKTFQPDWVTL